jgi:hypothetical protein
VMKDAYLGNQFSDAVIKSELERDGIDQRQWWIPRDQRVWWRFGQRWWWRKSCGVLPNSQRVQSG